LNWLGPTIRPLVTPIDIYGDSQRAGPSMLIVEFFADTDRLAMSLSPR
jgi:hypothetical protein